MRILHLADLHLRQDWFQWVFGQVASGHFDLVAIAGDFLDIFSSVPPGEQLETVETWLRSLKGSPVAVCTGNHDGGLDIASLRGAGSIVADDGDSWRSGEVRINVSGWNSAANLECDILVTHAPPAGCACAASGGRDHGDLDLADALRVGDGPRLILCGHIHEPQKRHCRFPAIDPFCTVLVPGFADAPVPNHWIIDTEKNRAMSESGNVVKF